MARQILYATFVLVSLFALTACFGPTGKVRIKTDIDNAQLFIDGDAVSSIGQDYIEMELSADNHLFEIKGLSEDEEWRYYGSDELLIPENAVLEKRIPTSSVETEKRKRRRALEQKQREAERLAEKVKDEFTRRQAAAAGGMQ